MFDSLIYVYLLFSFSCSSFVWVAASLFPGIDTVMFTAATYRGKHGNVHFHVLLVYRSFPWISLYRFTTLLVPDRGFGGEVAINAMNGRNYHYRYQNHSLPRRRYVYFTMPFVTAALLAVSSTSPVWIRLPC